MRIKLTVRICGLSISWPELSNHMNSLSFFCSVSHEAMAGLIEIAVVYEYIYIRIGNTEACGEDDVC